MGYLLLKRNWCLRIVRHNTNEVKWARSPTDRVHMSPLTQATSGSLSSALNFCSVRLHQTKRPSRHNPLLTLLTNPQPIDYFSYCWALLVKAVNWSLRQTLRWAVHDSHSHRAFSVSGEHWSPHPNLPSFRPKLNFTSHKGTCLCLAPGKVESTWLAILSVGSLPAIAVLVKVKGVGNFDVPLAL